MNNKRGKEEYAGRKNRGQEGKLHDEEKYIWTVNVRLEKKKRVNYREREKMESTGTKNKELRKESFMPWRKYIWAVNVTLEKRKIRKKHKEILERENGESAGTKNKEIRKESFMAWKIIYRPIL